MADEIIVKYTADVSGFKAEMKSTQAEIKATETTAVTAGKATTDSFKKTENAAVSLKTQLKQLKAQLAVATDPKDVERLARAAGEIENKLGDATKAAKIFASDSKFEQVRTAIGGIGRNILSLNFKQAAVESNLLVSAVRSITFKESISGLKDLATSLLNVGKALLTNPIFLIGSAITGIVIAYQKWNEAEEANKKVVIDANKEKLESLKEYNSFQERLITASGAKDTEITKQKIDNLKLLINENIVEQNRLAADRENLSDDEIKRLNELKDEEVKIRQELQILLAAQQKKATEDFLASEKKRIADRQQKEKEAAADLAKLQKRLAEVEIEDKTNAERAKNKVLVEFDKKEIESQKEVNKSLLELEEQQTKDFEQALKERFNLNQEFLKEAQKKNEEQSAEFQKEEKARQEEILAEEFALFSQAANSLFEYQNNLDNAQIDNLDQSLKRGAISQEEYDKKVAEIRLKQAKRDKEQALFNIAVDTAEAVIKAIAVSPETFGLPFSAFALAAGAIQAALVASKPLPKFAEGTERVKGGQKGVDSVHALLMPDEAVIKANENMAHPGLAKAWNSGYLDQFIMEQYIEPKLSAILGDSMANNMAKSAKINGLNEYSLARVMSRNKGVNVQNADYIAKAIAREMKNSSPKHTWSA